MNTSGTRVGLKENSGRGKQESEDNAYVLVNNCSEVIIRAKRCSNVSPMNSGSSLTSTLYFNIIIVIAAMLSVSKNLKKKTLYKYLSRLVKDRVCSYFLPRHARAPVANESCTARCHDGTKPTCAERQEGIPWPVLEEPPRPKCMGILPIPSCGTR